MVESVQLPPTSAEPSPLVLVRSNASRANTLPTGGGVVPDDTVTDRDVAFVAPSLSVTVSVTV